MTLHQPVGPLRPLHPPARTRAQLGLVTAAVLSLSLLAGGAAAAQDAASPPASPAATPAPDAPRITIEFEELNDSGVTGEAVLFEFGDQTIVELELEGTGENHPAHIHEGTCDDIEPEAAYNLENVGEEGTSTSVVDAPLQDLIDGDYVVDLHLAPNQLGTLIVCAEIEGTPEVPSVGGEGTPTAEATDEPTETATEQPATEDASTQATEEATAEVTVAPTDEPTAEPTDVATAEPTAEATTADTDGTGGITATNTPTDGTGADSTTSGVSDPTSSGKGVPVGGAAVGDGTSGESNALSGKGEPVGGTDGLPQTTGSGSSLFSPERSNAIAIQGLAAVAAILTFAGIMIRRGEHHRAAPSRFRRLGL